MLNVKAVFQSRYFHFLSDIRFWLFALFILHLENITAPPLDLHSWRQALTITVARNFQEISPNPFFPHTNNYEKEPGILAGEFPIFNYLIYIFYLIFGFQDWYGRLINVTISVLGLWYFYQIGLRICKEPAAFWATLFLGLSLFFKYSRKTMPDTFSISLVFIGIYFFWRFLEDGRNYRIVLGTLLMALGILSKIPAACPTALLIIALLDPKITVKRRLYVVGGVAISGVLGALWYFIWVPYLLNTYHCQLFWPETIEFGLKVFREMDTQVLLRFHDASFGYRLSFFIALMGLGGLVLQPENKRLFAAFVVYFLLFGFFILKTGIVFPTHDYYMLQIIPLLSLGAGYFASRMPLPDILRVAITIFLLNLNLNHQRLDVVTPKQMMYNLSLKAIADQYVPKDSRILTNGGAFSPVVSYFAGRHGYAINNDVFFKTDWMPDFQKEGLNYIVLDRHYSDLNLPYSLLFENEDYKIYKL